MISQADFIKQAKRHQIIPIWRELVADMATPVGVFQRLVGSQEGGFLLESVESNQRWGRFSFIGRRPLATFSCFGNEVAIESHPKDLSEAFEGLSKDRGMLTCLKEVLEKFDSPKDLVPVPFSGGVAGYLGYDIVREIEHLPNTPYDDRNLPDAVMEVIGQLAAFDHWRQRVVLVENILLPEDASESELKDSYEAGVQRLEEFAGSGTHSQPEPLLEPPDSGEILEEMNCSLAPKDYELAVEAAKEHILEGDILQVVLSERFDFDLDADPFDVYRVLRQTNPSPYMFFLSYPEMSIVGASPEALAQVRDGQVVARPIAGTRPRGETEKEDLLLAGELAEHPKEKAEHIMLVDLARNDLGRVVEYGTLKVDELMTLERYSHVMHMTSQVSGKLAEEFDAVEVLRSTFPAGTVSGAPKVRAMEIIDSLEPLKRGPYAGMVGYLDFSGNLDSAIAIRTMVVKGNKGWIQAGAGIVADSAAAAEEKECRNKAGALLAAVPAARKMSAARKNQG